MIIGYVRVSTVEQHEDRQLVTMEKYKVEKIFQEKVSAKDTNRPGLQAMLEFAREGDTIIVHDFSRLARSTKDLLDLVENLNSRGINLISSKENIDSSTPQGKLMLTMLGAIYEFERTNTLERQREGIAIAKEKGAYKGRKKIDFPSNWDEVYPKWKNREFTGAKAMEMLGLKRNTFYKLVKEYENKQRESYEKVI